MRIFTVELVICKTMWDHNTNFWGNWKAKQKQASKHAIYFTIDLLFHKNNWQVCTFFINLYFTTFFRIQSKKPKLLLEPLCLYKYPNNIERALNDSCGDVSWIGHHYCSDIFKSLWVSAISLWSKPKPQPSSKITWVQDLRRLMRNKPARSKGVDWCEKQCTYPLWLLWYRLVVYLTTLFQ
jgi:hypothetical protein